MADASSAGAVSTARPRPVLGPILSTVAFTFATYLTIGLSLAVLPGFVHNRLGYGALIAGLAISMQYVATLLSRPRAGHMADVLGPRRTVLTGLAMCAISGALLMAGASAMATPAPSLGLILLARLALGCAESCVGTGAITWGMGQVGHQHTAKVISWNGVATYGGLAAGAPLGVAIAASHGLFAIGLLTLVLMLVALPLASLKRPSPVSLGERESFRQVASKVVPYGFGLALGSIGFGCIATFVTLFYASRGWHGAALSLSVFGITFVGARFVFTRTIDRWGGYRVAMVSFAVEMIGLLMLWLAHDVFTATLGAGVAGLGFSLVFPALGVEAVKRVPAHSRGAAIGVFSVFLDVAMALAGPLGGWAASGLGFASIYGIAAVAAIAGLVLTQLLRLRVAGAATH